MQSNGKVWLVAAAAAAAACLPPDTIPIGSWQTAATGSPPCDGSLRAGAGETSWRRGRWRGSIETHGRGRDDDDDGLPGLRWTAN
ncbi:hypothetical protein CKAH01_03167 [Colletotrichum kahawae]|uniref:Secreted protein n=1 Tax=Colletotrichum kahawae TaxID=34407 RepID=A0AAE0DDG4_COLKA|nr:hypothetical protein CKAH01_03167 [Colletotrichum kahawae]